MHKIGELEISQALKFERRSWKVERIGWAIAAAILLASLLGLLGRGPLSKATATSSDKSLTLKYHKLDRCHAPVEFEVRVDGRFARNGALRLWLDRTVAETIKFEHIDPTPDAIEINGERFVYIFKTVEPPALARICFYLEAIKSGKCQTRLGVIDGPEITFSQFYFP
jgi:hypothetical protein